jgi:hypothetical protein
VDARPDLLCGLPRSPDAFKIVGYVQISFIERERFDKPGVSLKDRMNLVGDFAVRLIEAGVIAMANDVWAWCEKANSRGRTVTVKIKWADFQLSTRSRSMESAIQTRHGSRTFNRNPEARGLNCLFVEV